MTTRIEHVPCDHPDQPHTVYVGIDDGGPPVPTAHNFDNQEDAIEFARAINRTRIWLIKVFRTDSESYTCYQWAPEPEELSPDTIAVHPGDWAKFKRRHLVRWLLTTFLILAVLIALMLIGLEGHF